MRKIFTLIFQLVLFTGCASTLKNTNLLEIVNNEIVIYDWVSNINKRDLINITIENTDNKKLGYVYQKGEGIIRKYNFVYDNGKEVELLTMGDYTWPIKLTQANDNTLHLFYFAGISMHRYMLVEFNIDTGKLKQYGLPRRNSFYSDFYK